MTAKREPFITTCDGITLRGELFLPQSITQIKMVVICHGIPRERPREGDPGYLPLAERFVREGYGALIFNFRGCGVSDGNFDIMGWGRDLLAVVDTLYKIPFVASVILWGFSGGAAASVWAASHNRKISAAALFACPADFAGLRDIPVTSVLVEYFRKVGIIRDAAFPADEKAWIESFDKINPEKHIPLISPRPVLIVHSTADQTVPVGHAHRLMDAAREPKMLKIIEGAPHRLRESPEALETAFSWLKGL